MDETLRAWLLILTLARLLCFTEVGSKSWLSTSEFKGLERWLSLGDRLSFRDMLTMNGINLD